MDNDKKISANGIKYQDFNNLHFCNFFHTIMEPPLNMCHSCFNSRDILEIQEEKCKTWVDCSGKLNENDTGKNAPVIAELVIATVKGKHGEKDKKIILNNFPGSITWCPFG
jgi:hypothetical protein